MKSSTRFELVMWCAFAAFYVALVGLVWCVLFGAPLQISGGLLLGAVGLLAGAHHARAIHQDNKISGTRSAGSSAAMDGNGWD